jgi:hypothetical protein
LSLNVFYANPADQSSGGTWQLVGRSSGSGINSLQVLLTGVNPDISSQAPTATVNGIAGSGGLRLLGIDSGPQYRDIVLSQLPLVSLPGEQPLFYGIGTLENGSPAFAGQAPGTNSLGPNFTTLTNPLRIPWAADEDVFGDNMWDSAASLLSGSFAAGTTPGFFADGQDFSRGTVFTSIGTSSNPGNFSDFLSTIVTTTVRTNLVSENGDYNRDGVVDAADYTVWRDTLGASVTAGSGADGNFDGLIDNEDYAVWRRLFGTTPPGSLIAGPGGVSVPEADAKTLGILTVLVVGAMFCRGRMRSCRAFYVG